MRTLRRGAEGDATARAHGAAPSASRGGALQVFEMIGLALIFAPLLVRATLAMTMLPGWDVDPIMSPLDVPALGPWASLFIDHLVLGGGMLLLLGTPRRVSLVWGVLALCGLGLLLPHFIEDGFSLHDWRIGMSWVAGIFAGCMVWQRASLSPAFRRAAAGVMLGFVSLLALKALQQIVIEHPATVADFQAHKAELLASRGWEAGSPSALAFERRAMQSEATGWFGLANVLATFGAAAGVCGVVLSVLTLRGRAGAGAISAAVAVALSGLGCVVAAGSKAGWMGVAIGLGAAVVFAVLRRIGERSLQRAKTAGLLAGLVGIGAVIAPLLLVAVRGLIGERIGELSLLFRWFYAQGAWAIFREHPLTGVGPDGFQRAYSLAKPALSVEDVMSPHALAYDWLATMGILGFAAWMTLLVVGAWAIGRGGVRAETDSPSVLSRTDVRAAMGVAVIATLFAAFFELGAATPETAIMRVVGLAAGCLVIFGVMRMAARGLPIGLPLAAMGCVLLAQGQIDVAGSFPASAGLYFVMLGLAAANGRGRARTSSTSVEVDSTSKLLARPMVACAAGAMVVALAWFSPPVSKSRAWERLLVEAADEVRVIGEIQQRLRLSQDPSMVRADPSLSVEQVVRDLGHILGREIKVAPTAVSDAMMELETQRLPRGVQKLKAAYTLVPSDRRVLREWSQLTMRQAMLASARGNTADAERLATEAVNGFDVTASSTDEKLSAADFRWAATLHERRAEMLGSTDRGAADRMTALHLLGAALERDPYNMDHALRAFRLAQSLGDAAETRTWAKRVLELEPLQRLDAAVKGLGDKDRQAVEEALKTPA